MEWLNYHHLLYFWVVAREGSVAKACQRLNLAQPTISGQIRALEQSLKTALFERSGRNLVLTETGYTVYRYADEIFSLGRELQDTLQSRPTGRAVRFVVGVADALPKLIAHRLLEPALHLPEDVQVTCFDGDPDHLIAKLALHELDLVLSDVPANPRLGFRAFNHLLGECGVTFFGTEDLAQKYRKGFPKSLQGAPFLMPTGNVALRRSLEQWFDTLGIRPRIQGEFADSALLKAFGQVGHGLFAAPSVVEADVKRMYRVAVVGRDDSLCERFYAVSVEKRIKHPAVLAISEAAKAKLFHD
jgi:LysR family transcriptional regulator, transcriptional activator of nhaA